MPDPIHILYIDDDAGLGRLVQRALEPTGCKVTLPVRAKSCWSRLTWTLSTYRADRRPARPAPTTTEAEVPVYWR